MLLKISNIFYSCISISGSIPSSLQEKTIRDGKHIKQKYSAAKLTKNTSSVKSGLDKNAEQGHKRDSSEYINDQTERFKVERTWKFPLGIGLVC